MASRLLNPNICPCCGEPSLHGRKRICPSCTAHVRYPGDTVVPIARNFYVFGPKTGWRDSTAMGLKLEFDQSCVPVMPSDMTPQTKQEENDCVLHEKKCREMGVKSF